MSSFLLTDIALDLLGNKFYTPDGKHVRNLNTLYQLSRSEPPTGEPSLQTLLCISETSLRAAGNLQSDVIVLDDEDEKFTAEISEELDAALASSSKPTKRKPKKLKARTDSPSTSQESCKKSQPGSSSKSTDRKFEYKMPMNLHTEDVNHRLSNIVKASSKEYAEMKQESNTEKGKFLQLQGAGEGNIQAYYKKEKEALLKEKKILMDFLKTIGNDPNYPKDVLARIEGDILKAKDILIQKWQN